MPIGFLPALAASIPAGARLMNVLVDAPTSTSAPVCGSTRTRNTASAPLRRQVPDGESGTKSMSFANSG